MEALGKDVFAENDQMFDKSSKNFSSSLLEVQRTHMHVENSSKLISMDIKRIQFLFYMHLKLNNDHSFHIGTTLRNTIKNKHQKKKKNQKG
jgi:hypothetical protein